MILHNRKNHSVVLHFTTTSGNVIVAGNNTVSNIATGAEVVESASIAKITWGIGGNTAGYWTVARGGTTLLICAAPGGTYDLAALGAAVNANNTQNLVCTANFGAGVGHIIVEMKKINSTVAPIT